MGNNPETLKEIKQKQHRVIQLQERIREHYNRLSEFANSLARITASEKIIISAKADCLVAEENFGLALVAIGKDNKECFEKLLESLRALNRVKYGLNILIDEKLVTKKSKVECQKLLEENKGIAQLLTLIISEIKKDSRQ